MEEASGFRDIAPNRHPPSRVGRCQAGCQAMPEQAERDFSPVRQEHTGGLFSATGRRLILAAPSPHSCIPSLWVGSVPWDHRGSGRFAHVRVLFALLGWTCLYLFKKPGDAQELGELLVVSNV